MAEMSDSEEDVFLTQSSFNGSERQISAMSSRNLYLQTVGKRTQTKTVGLTLGRRQKDMHQKSQSAAMKKRLKQTRRKR